MLDKLLRAAAITVLLSVLMHEGVFTAHYPISDRPLPPTVLSLQRR